MLFHEWTEFVTYPTDSSRVRSRAERLDTSHSAGAVVPLATILNNGDVFECMEIEDSGWVIIWTRNKVWFLAREGQGGRIEKLRYVPRHPPATSPQPNNALQPTAGALGVPAELGPCSRPDGG